MMSLKNSLIVLWVYILYVIGLWLFLSGYLLKRIVVHQNSTSSIKPLTNLDCKQISNLRFIGDNLNRRTLTFPMHERHNSHQYGKAIIIIIDALSFDFVKYSKPKPGSEFHQNKMPVFKHLMTTQPDRARLFRLLVDPPTTTLQRLKGLTTGSLPTFIDVSLNFASPEITEDNLVWQMVASNKNIVFMGDDTWDSLFPGQFHRKFSYPSFNVKDLDTVDDGILEHLYEEMEKPDSDIIIAHFLGVDHCGHRYGPKHPEMTRKLQQMNSVIQNVSAKMQNDTILLVLGDHGMTESGDHGGDSLLEITTALFVYSHFKLPSIAKDEIPVINQVDLVPTLSILLGLPIPFSNLGRIVTSLLSPNPEKICFNEETDKALTDALTLAENSLQVQIYLESYSQLSSEFPHSLVESNQEKLKEINLNWNTITHNLTQNLDTLSNISSRYIRYLEDIREICSEKWATFNLNLIVVGILVLCISISSNFWTAGQLNNKHLIAIFGAFMFLSSVSFFYVYNLFNVTNYLAVLAGVLIILLLTVNKYIDYVYVLIICCPLLVLLYITNNLNFLRCNSSDCLYAAIVIIFVVIYMKFFHENCINLLKAVFSVSFFTTIILFLTSFSNSFVVNEDRIALYLLQSLLLYRFLSTFTEPIKSYFPSSNKQKIPKKLPKGNLKSFLHLILLISLITCIRLGSAFYKCREEQLSCQSFNIIVSLDKLHETQTYKLMRLVLSLCSGAIPVAVLLGIICYKYALKAQTLSAVCLRYGIFFVCVLTSLRWWLNIVPSSVVDRILKGNEVFLTRTAFLTIFFLLLLLIASPILVNQPWEFSSREVYSGSHTTFVFVVLQLLYLVSGDAFSTAVMLMAISALLFALLFTLSSSSSSPPTPESQLWLDVLIWSLLSRHWFYATAHQATFASIQWDAAFLLNHKEVHSYALSGALVLINTFSSRIFHGLALPVIFIPQDASFLTSKYLLRLHMKLLFFYGVQMFGTICAAFVLRRHLMVWKIFTPKMLYEVIGMLISMVSVSFGHYFMAKVTSQYHKLLRMNMSYMFSAKEQ